MSDLTIEYRMFREKTNELFELYGKLCALIEKTAEDTEKLDIFWDGDANYAYISRIEKDMIAAGEILKRIRDTIRTASKAFDMYNENERKVKQMIGGVRK